MHVCRSRFESIVTVTKLFPFSFRILRGQIFRLKFSPKNSDQSNGRLWLGLTALTKNFQSNSYQPEEFENVKNCIRTKDDNETNYGEYELRYSPNNIL